MRKTFALLLMLGLASCATTSPSSSVWSKIEGCWVEQSDHWPASMTWRDDPDRPGAYLGHWRREAAQGDLDEFQFVLTPAGDHMQLCMRYASGGGRCDRAVFGRAGWRQDGVAVFDVDGDYQAFGYAGSTAPFFWGRRGECS